MSDEAFARDVLKIAVAAACNQMDFTNIESSALEVLIDLVQIYFRQVGVGAATNAELSGRTECNYFDIKRSLEELGVVAIEELIRFNEHASVLPWPRESVEHFVRKPSLPPTIRSPVEALPPHIPNFLPPFPDHRSYVQTPVYNQRETDAKKILKQKKDQRLQAEKNLTAFHTRESEGGRQLNIINYDQVYDPRSTQRADLPFQLAKDPIEVTATSDAEPVLPGPRATAIPKDRLELLLDPSGESHNSISPLFTGKDVDEATQRRVEQVINLEHHDNSIQHVQGKK